MKTIEAVFVDEDGWWIEIVKMFDDLGFETEDPHEAAQVLTEDEDVIEVDWETGDSIHWALKSDLIVH